MGQMFQGLTYAAPFLALGILLIWKKKAPRVAAWSMFLAGCAMVGTWFNSLVAAIVNSVPPAAVIVAAILCGGAFILDVWGKNNHAGKVTAIVGLIAPLLIVTAPLSFFGIDPGDLVKEVNSVTREVTVVKADN